LLFSDPPKPGIAETIASLADRGVKLKIITGDNRYVAAHIATRYSESNGVSMAGLLGAGLVLFLFTLIINTLAGVVVSRSRSGAATEI